MLPNPDDSSAASVSAAVAAAREGLSGLRQVLYQVPSQDLQPLLGQLRELVAWGDAGSVSVVAEAWSRGVIQPTPRGLVSTAAVIEWIQASIMAVEDGADRADRHNAAADLPAIGAGDQVPTTGAGGQVPTTGAGEVHPIGGGCEIVSISGAGEDTTARARQSGDVDAADVHVMAARAVESGVPRGLVPPVDRVTAFRLATLARAAQGRSRAVLAEAVCTASVGLCAGVVALAEFDRLAPRLVDGMRDEALGWFTQVAASNDLAQVRGLRPAIIARYGNDGELERLHEAARQSRLFSSPIAVDGVGGDGVCQYALVAPAEAVAVIEAAIDRLCAPAPTTTEPDLRSSGQRRFDALLAVLTRGVSAPASVPGTAHTTVMVTMPLTDLTDAVRGVGQFLGQRCGTGTAGASGGYAGGAGAGGPMLDPGTVRRMACDANLIPVVLGTESQPLDVGRTHRLVTPSIRTALWVRDRGCTYPGCTVPAAWTDAHHIRHWAEGGPTRLDNLTLLCARHHTAVHTTGATALVEHGHVHWAIPRSRHRPHAA